VTPKKEIRVVDFGPEKIQLANPGGFTNLLDPARSVPPSVAADRFGTCCFRGPICNLEDRPPKHAWSSVLPEIGSSRAVPEISQQKKKPTTVGWQPQNPANSPVEVGRFFHFIT